MCFLRWQEKNITFLIRVRLIFNDVLSATLDDKLHFIVRMLVNGQVPAGFDHVIDFNFLGQVPYMHL